MRRYLLTLTASGLLLLSAACNTDGATPLAVATSASASALSPTDAKTCQELMAAVETAMPKFGNELGKILAAKAQKQQAQAKQARDEARQLLKKLATQIRDIAATADPALKAAAAKAAAKVQRSAKDAKFFHRLETIDGKPGTLQDATTDWMLPITTICV